MKPWILIILMGDGYAIGGGYILQESGSKILQEDGSSGILQES